MPEHWSQVAADILAQKYFRKAGVPARLQQRRGDAGPVLAVALGRRRARARRAARGRALRRRDRRPPGLRPPRRLLDLLGLEGRLLLQRGRRARLLRRAPLHAGHADGRAQQPAVVQHRPALGLRHRRARPGPLLRRPRDRRADALDSRPTSIPQPHACFIQSIEDDLVNEGGIMDLWVREARIFKYGSGTGTNFSKLRGENEQLSGGGKSSGLMSFLKIGDRAAGAIKSGGTTRRAAKMVVLDLDHPDIEEFINWKVIEEQKVAALVTGSKICQKRLKAIMKACVNCEADGDDLLRSRKNPALKRAIKEARRDLVPDNYILRVIQFARQGYKEIEFDDLRHRLGLRGLPHRLRPELQQLGARHRRFLQRGRGRRRLGADGAARRQARQDAEGPRPVGPDRLRGLGLGRPRRAVRHHDQRWHTCPSGADQRVQSVLGVHVPRRHGLQPRLAQPDDVPNADDRASFDVDASSMPAGCGRSCSRSRSDGAVPVAAGSPSCPTTSARWAWASPTSAACLMAPGIPYDSPRAAPSAAPSRRS